MRAVILGGGIIGLSLARELAGARAEVIIVDPQEPAREASWAAAGMLAPDSEAHGPAAFLELRRAARDLYPEYVTVLEKETRRRTGLRTAGTIVVAPGGSVEDALREPELVWRPAKFFPRDYSIDNRLLTAALLTSCQKRGVRFERAAALAVDRGAAVLEGGRRLEADFVVNAAGCWASKIQAPLRLDIRPVKGQMVAVRAEGWKLRHTVRDDHVYLVPRDDGRILLGATMEEAGYDKSVDAQVIRGFLEAGARLVPKIRNSPVVESWAGLRPATRNGLPLIGPASLPGYYLAVGHLRDGILLAPITAKLLSEAMLSGRLPRLLRPWVPQ